MELGYFIYQSQALCDANDPMFGEIVRTSHDNNFRDLITGFLHHENEAFVQYVEGPQRRLNALKSRLERDPRHKNIVYIDEGTIQKRNFPDWQMACSNDTRFSLAEIFGLDGEGLDLSDVRGTDLVRIVSTNAMQVRALHSLNAITPGPGLRKTVRRASSLTRSQTVGSAT